MVDDAHLGFGDADMATVDRADLARMMRENTELSDGGGHRHVRDGPLIHALLGANDSQLHGLCHGSYAPILAARSRTSSMVPA